MKFTGFAATFVGKLLLVIFCILLGVVLAVGGEALAGYIVLTREGMVGTIADAVQERMGADSSLQVTFDDETKAMSLLEWGTGLASSFSNLSGSNIGSIEKLIGFNVISSTLSDMLGIDAEIIKESALGDIGTTLSKNMTLALAQDKFGIQFPDMPLFRDEEFLAKPLSEAFADFDQFKLEEVISIGEDANVVLKKMKSLRISELGGSATTDIINNTELGEVIHIDEHSNAVLQELQHTKIGDLGGSTTNDTINNMELGQVIAIDEHSNAVLQELQHTKIGDLGKSTTDDTIKGMFLCQLMTIDESSPRTLKSLKYATIESQYEAYPDDDATYPGQKKDGKGGRELVYQVRNYDGSDRPLKGISETMEEMELGDAIDITASSNAVLKELATTRINELGSPSTDVTIKSMFLDQIMTIDESSSQTLKNLKYACIESQYEEYASDDPDFPGQKKDGKGGRALEYKTKSYAGEDRDLIGINEKLNELELGEVITIDSNSHAVLQELEHTKINDLGGATTKDTINSMFMDQLMDINGSSPMIMQSIRYACIQTQYEVYPANDPTYPGQKKDGQSGRALEYKTKFYAGEDRPLMGIGDKVNNLKLCEIFSDLSSGALSLLDPNTTINNIPAEVTKVMFNATVATMVGKGIIDSGSMTGITNMKYQQQAFMYNSNMSDMLSGVIEFINDPYTVSGMTVTLKYDHISPHNETVNTMVNYESLKSFIATYSQYDSITFDGGIVSIEVNPVVDADLYDADAGCYLIPLFNTKTAVTFNISGGGVKMGVFDVLKSGDAGFATAESIATDSNGDKYTAISRNQYGYAYANQNCTNAITPAAGSAIIYDGSADPAKID